MNDECGLPLPASDPYGNDDWQKLARHDAGDRNMNEPERRIAAAIMHSLDGVDDLEGLPGWKSEVDWAGVLGRDPRDGDLMFSAPGGRTVGIHFEVRITSDDRPELAVP